MKSGMAREGEEPAKNCCIDCLLGGVGSTECERSLGPPLAAGRSREKAIRVRWTLTDVAIKELEMGVRLSDCDSNRIFLGQSCASGVCIR